MVYLIYQTLKKVVPFQIRIMVTDQKLQGMKVMEMVETLLILPTKQ